ncbi:RNA polymerase sigma factor [Nonomuraea sp. NPDC049695]|uniref:RNA polymerase sigma factor n=1 Tax=Nonomuraea sp. NPDC049695 TaxID=3154734 RepID=UPI00343517BB
MAFDLLFVRVIPDLKRRIMGTAHHATDIDDVIHDLYLKLRSSAAHEAALLHPNPRAYLIRAALNQMYDNLRKANRRQRLANAFFAGAEDAWDGGLANREDALLVSAALGELTRSEAAAVVLIDLCGQTIDQSAQMLGLHRGTVHRNRQRGLRRLRALLGNLGYPPRADS